MDSRCNDVVAACRLRLHWPNSRFVGLVFAPSLNFGRPGRCRRRAQDDAVLRVCKLRLRLEWVEGFGGVQSRIGGGGLAGEGHDSKNATNAGNSPVPHYVFGAR